MRRRCRVFLVSLLCMITFFLVGTTVKAAQEKDAVGDNNDYSDIQKIIDESLVSKDGFSFESFVNQLVNNKQMFSVDKVFGEIKDGVVKEFNSNIGIMGRLIAIAIVAAIFTSFASVFMDNQVAETGFYITYILLFTMIVSCFHSASLLAERTVENVLTFVKVLIPTYFMSVSVSTGAVSSIMFYEFTLIVISIVNVLMIHIILPLINVYLIILLADNLSKEDKLSKLAKTLGTAIKWTLRSLVVLVIGFNAVQSLITPVADGLKRSIFVKMGGLVPGVGNLLSGVTETVMGASILLKNAIGVAGLVAIIVICALPVIKIVVYYFIFRISESVVQPVSDKRILKCMGACCEAVSMVLQVVLVAAILFILSITIVTASTTMVR